MDTRDIDLLFPEEQLIAYARHLLASTGHGLEPVSAIRPRRDTVILLCMRAGKNVRLVAPLAGYGCGEIRFRAILEASTRTQTLPFWESKGDGDFTEIAVFGEDGPRLRSSAAAVESWIRSEPREHWQDVKAFDRETDMAVEHALERGGHPETFEIVDSGRTFAIGGARPAQGLLAA